MRQRWRTDPATEKAKRQFSARDYIALGGILVAIAGVVAAFLTVHYQHEDQKELMRLQVGLEMVKTFDSSDMRRARKNFSRTLLKGEPAIRDERVLDFFETVSLYFDQDRIDADTVYVNFSYWIERYWAASKDAVYVLRKAEADDELYAGFEELTQTMAAYRGSGPALSSEQIRAFLQQEAALP